MFRKGSISVDKSVESTEELRLKLKKTEEQLASERAGRITGEKRLRKLIQDSGDKSNRLPPIGVIKSPFRSRAGCPRQGGQVENVPSEIHLHSFTQPENSLSGLTEYSHLWIIWEFHNNTNIGGNVKVKVKPPRANGEKWGIYATRTPHRHNNIGLSLVRIVDVVNNGKVIQITGADLMNDTPILDIKPYTPGFESIPHAKVPAWVGTDIEEMFEVSWTAEARQNVQDQYKQDHFHYYHYTDPTALEKTLEDIVRLQDVRNKHQKSLNTSEYSYLFDIFKVYIKIEDDTLHEAVTSEPDCKKRRTTRSASRAREEVVTKPANKGNVMITRIELVKQTD